MEILITVSEWRFHPLDLGWRTRKLSQGVMERGVRKESRIRNDNIMSMHRDTSRLVSREPPPAAPNEMTTTLPPTHENRSNTSS